jgi:hypothetical protein
MSGGIFYEIPLVPWHTLSDVEIRWSDESQRVSLGVSVRLPTKKG